MSTTNFTNADLLDAMMRAAFKPTHEPYTTYDSNGHVQVQYQLTDSLIAPLVRMVQDKIDKDEAFRALLTSKLIERIDAIVDAVVDAPASLGIIRKNDAGYNRPSDFKLVDWLQEPLGKVLAEQMGPSIVAKLEEAGTIDTDRANIEVTITVQPWPKAEAS